MKRNGRASETCRSGPGGGMKGLPLGGGEHLDGFVEKPCDRRPDVSLIGEGLKESLEARDLVGKEPAEFLGEALEEIADVAETEADAVVVLDAQGQGPEGGVDESFGVLLPFARFGTVSFLFLERRLLLGLAPALGVGCFAALFSEFPRFGDQETEGVVQR